MRAPDPLSVKGIPLLARTIPNGTGQLLVEFERDEPAYADFQTLLYRCRLDIAALRRLDDLDAVVGRAAQVVRSLTELDRVMIYRFDEHWNGEVIAEACAPGIESYLGLHYPAGDIPRQARELFRTGGIRHLPDVHYQPSALVSAADGRSFDLGAVSLRSVSPVHLEYLRNMGVRATLVGSLVVRDRLWGLVSCQHVRGPKRFSGRVSATPSNGCARTSRRWSARRSSGAGASGSTRSGSGARTSSMRFGAGR